MLVVEENDEKVRTCRSNIKCAGIDVIGMDEIDEKIAELVKSDLE